MNNQQNQKSLKFNRKNFFTGIFLLTLVNLIGPFFVDPRVGDGQAFYFFIAFVTAFCFPWLTVEEKTDETKSN